ncbi:MAG: hypothetical protein ACYTGL_27255 [Planctomycetota bacterium]|jgi:hypothetical protein
MKSMMTWSSGLLVLALTVTGCSDGRDTTTDTGATGQTSPPADVSTDAPAEHAPHGAGPNGGVIFDLGKYHAEFTVDHDKQTVMLLIVGNDEKTPVPITAEELTLTTKEARTADGTVVPAMTIALSPQDEQDGKATIFTGTDPGIGNVADFDGTVLGLIDGKPSQGEFSESHGGAHGHAHGHSHGENDALVWEGGPVEHSGTTILLGHHGKHLHAGEEVEPAVSIVRDGKPVSDAKVFNALVSADTQTVLAKEVATVYEPTTEEEPAHYAQGGLAIPKDVKKVVIRFRIVLPGEDAKTFDVPVAVE